MNMYVFQLVNPTNGYRSEALTSGRNEFARHLHESGIAEHDPETLVLCLMEGDSSNVESIGFSRAPLMRVETFVGHFLKEDDENV